MAVDRLTPFETLVLYALGAILGRITGEATSDLRHFSIGLCLQESARSGIFRTKIGFGFHDRSDKIFLTASTYEVMAEKFAGDKCRVSAIKRARECFPLDLFVF